MTKQSVLGVGEGEIILCPLTYSELFENDRIVMLEPRLVGAKHLREEWGIMTPPHPEILRRPDAIGTPPE